MDLSALEERYEDLYILSRFMYRIGTPILDDETFNSVERYIKDINALPEYTSRLYDDDPIPFGLLTEFNLNAYIPALGSSSEYAKYLDEEKSLSIQPYTNYTDTFNFCMAKKADLIISLKTDGVNTKTLYMDKLFRLSLSRGRSGNSLDFTRNISRIMPSTLDVSKLTKDETNAIKTNKLNINIKQDNIDEQYKEVKVYAETFVYEDYLPVLRSKYDSQGYKTAKSSAISLLRVDKECEDYKYLKALAFHAEGLPNVKTKEDILVSLDKLGFTVVPYCVFKWEDIPKDKENFIEWLNIICEEFYVKTEMYPSDGLVIEVNDLDYVDSVSGIYSNRNMALKLNYWSFARYMAEVEDIILEQQRVKCSCRVKIKPIRTKDGCEAKIVNVHNPKILINNNINIGSRIAFERNSGAINTLVYGKALTE